MIIYTDGSCLRNPGPGGWAWIALSEKDSLKVSEGCGFLSDTTNNQMELQAVISALEWLIANQVQEKITLLTDSRYVQQGISEWIYGWKRRNWRSSTGEPVKNQPYWITLDSLRAHLTIDWQWVKAHDTNPWNNYVDQKARECAIRGAS